MKTRYKNVTVDPDRHGKLRARFRKGGRSVYMKHLPDQPGFQAEYDALFSARPQPKMRHVAGSVHHLCTLYYQSADFLDCGGEDDKRRRRGLIESFRAEFGNDLVSDFRFNHIEAILIARSKKRENEKGRQVGGAVAAVNLRKQLVRLFDYAEKLEWIAPGANPVKKAKRVGSAKIKGYHTWSEAEIAQYQKTHAVGTKARLYLEIILWTGQRRGDARLFGPKHIVGGKVNYKASKTDADLWLPLARDLKRAIAAMPKVGIRTFLVTEAGEPYSKDGVGNAMREWCDAAGLPQCSSHGLRKAIGRRMAQLRLSDEEMMAVGGWKDTQSLRVYTEAVEQEHLADGALKRVDDAYSTEQKP